MGISATQGRFLSERLLCNTDKEAAERIGVKPNTVGVWKLDCPEFRALYDKLGQDGVNIALEILRQNLGKAAEAVIDALQAKDSRGKPDHVNRMTAAKLAMQAHGLLKTQQVHSGDPDNPIQNEMVVTIVRSGGRTRISHTGTTPGAGADSEPGETV